MTDATLESMIKRAISARDSAYAPYSKHPVGVALRSVEGNIFVGANIENASSPLGNCAEPVAIANMIMAGDTAIEQVVVVGPGDHLCTPCGGCRQRIREFSTPDTQVTVCRKDGSVALQCLFSELLPHSFGPENVFEMADSQESTSE